MMTANPLPSLWNVFQPLVENTSVYFFAVTPTTTESSSLSLSVSVSPSLTLDPSRSSAPLDQQKVPLAFSPVVKARLRRFIVALCHQYLKLFENLWKYPADHDPWKFARCLPYSSNVMSSIRRFCQHADKLEMNDAEKRLLSEVFVAAGKRFYARLEQDPLALDVRVRIRKDPVPSKRILPDFATIIRRPSAFLHQAKDSILLMNLLPRHLLCDRVKVMSEADISRLLKRRFDNYLLRQVSSVTPSADQEDGDDYDAEKGAGEENRSK